MGKNIELTQALEALFGKRTVRLRIPKPARGVAT